MVMAISQVLPGIQWAQSNGPPKQALDPAPAKNTGRLTLAKRGQLRACPGLAQAGLTFSFLPAPLVSLKFQSSSEELSLHREGRGLFAFCSFPDNLVTVCSGHTEKKKCSPLTLWGNKISNTHFRITVIKTVKAKEFKEICFSYLENSTLKKPSIKHASPKAIFISVHSEFCFRITIYLASGFCKSP